MIFGPLICFWIFVGVESSLHVPMMVYCDAGFFLSQGVNLCDAGFSLSRDLNFRDTGFAKCKLVRFNYLVKFIFF